MYTIIYDFFDGFLDSIIVNLCSKIKEGEGYTGAFLVEKGWGDGVGVLWVVFRMKGVFTTKNPVFRFCILCLGVAHNFFSVVVRVSAHMLLGASA